MAPITSTDPIEEKVVAEPITNRKEAIASAITSLEEPTKEDNDKDGNKAEVKEEPKVDKEVEAAAEEKATNQAKELFKALNDPVQAPLFIDFLARQAGYTKGEIAKAAATKAETATLAEDTISILKESLGEEFGFLADKFAPAIEKILAKKVEESQKDIREEFTRQETTRLQNESATVMSKLADGFFGKGEELPDTVTSEMSKYMDRMQPSKGTSLKEYVEDAFNAAIGKLGLQKTDKDKQNRTNKNRTDAASRLASERVPAEENIQLDSKPMSRQQAIKAAVEAVDKQ
jgi:hypothetical protein